MEAKRRPLNEERVDLLHDLRRKQRQLVFPPSDVGRLAVQIILVISTCPTILLQTFPYPRKTSKHADTLSYSSILL